MPIATVPVVYEPLERADPPIIELYAEWSERPPGRSAFAVPRLVTCYGILGAWGGLSGARPPEHSTLVPREAHVTGLSGTWSFDAHGVDAGAIGSLRNLMAFSHHHVVPITSAAIRSSLTATTQWPGRLLGRHHPAPFAVEEDLDMNELLVSVEFQERPSRRDAAALRKLLVAWQYLAAAWAFEADLQDLRGPLLVPEMGPSWSDTELWSRIDLAGFDESAVDALVNALQRVHLQTARVELLDIS